MTVASERRVDVKNSLTEKCENCTTGEPPVALITASRVEHVDSTASAGSSRHQTSWYSGIDLALEIECEQVGQFLDVKWTGSH